MVDPDKVSEKVIKLFLMLGAATGFLSFIQDFDWLLIKGFLASVVDAYRFIVHAPARYLSEIFVWKFPPWLSDYIFLAVLFTTAWVRSVAKAKQDIRRFFQAPLDTERLSWTAWSLKWLVPMAVIILIGPLAFILLTPYAAVFHKKIAFPEGGPEHFVHVSDRELRSFLWHLIVDAYARWVKSIALCITLLLVANYAYTQFA